MNVENIHWLGHDSFRIEDRGKQIYIDPWKLSKNTPKADYIFVTHSHYDHFSLEDIEKITDNDTYIIGPPDVASQIKGNVIALKPGDEKSVGSLMVKGVHAYNINKKFHPKENDWLGFIIKLSDGITIYHAGDTDFIPEMRSLKVDIALIPVSGTYVMTAEEAVDAANTFMPKIAIPMHYGDIVGSEADAATFKNKFNGTTVIKQIER